MTKLNVSIRLTAFLVWLNLTCVAFSQAPKIEDRLSDPVYMAWLSEPSVSLCVECHLEGPGFGAIIGGNAGKLTEFSRRQEMEAWINQDKHTIARRRVEPRSGDQLDDDLNELFDAVSARLIKSSEYLLARASPSIATKSDCVVCPKNGLVTAICSAAAFATSCGGKTALTPRRVTTFPRRMPDLSWRSHAWATWPTAGIGDDEGDDWDRLFVLPSKWPANRLAKAHFNSDKWRLATPQVKLAQGMTDLADTSNQASLCLDCHIGNRDKNMFVTHEMYAAGHPPLPSVEVETFCQQMPMHWQTPGELYQRMSGYDQRATYFQINYPGVTNVAAGQGSQTFWNTRKIFIGALVARRKAVQTYLDSIEQDQWGRLFSVRLCGLSSRAAVQQPTSGSLCRFSHLSYAWTASTARMEPPTIERCVSTWKQRYFKRIRILEDELSACFDRQPFGLPLRRFAMPRKHSSARSMRFLIRSRDVRSTHR